MKKLKSPCEGCGQCQNPDSAFHSCKRWNQWFSQKWGMVRRQGERILKAYEVPTEVQKDSNPVPDLARTVKATTPSVAVEASAPSVKEKVCPWCQNVFTPHQHNQIYCCSQCTMKATAEREKEERKKYGPVLKEKTCPVCGKGFFQNTVWQKYCSTACCSKGSKGERYRPSMESWDQVVKRCSEAGCSYGEMVMKEKI